MGEPHVISALRDKRGELSGLIVELEARIGRHRATLVHLDATLLLFDPNIEPEAIRPRRPAVRNAWFSRGECTRLIFDTLRVAVEPLTTRAITDRLMAAKDLPAEDPRTLRLMAKTVQNALARNRRGVERVDRDGTTYWRAAA